MPPPRGSRQALTILVILAMALALWWFLRDESPYDGSSSPAAAASAGLVAAPADSAAASGPRTGTGASLKGALAPNPPAPPSADAKQASSSDSSGTSSAGDEPAAPAFSDVERADRDKPDERGALPRGWIPCYSAAGTNQTDYSHSSDFHFVFRGKASASIQSLVARPQPAGAAFCQFIAAAPYHGKRVEFSAQLATSNAIPGAHLTVRADAANGRIVAHDTMRGAWIPGTHNWLRQSIVIDIPPSAAVIMVGIALVNAGAVWMDDAALTVVDPSFPLTQSPAPLTNYSLAPNLVNLPPVLRNGDFEETAPRPPAR